MTDQHPITPPPELIQRWWDGTHGAFYEFEAVTTQAARWGWQQRNASVPGELQQVRDEELDACCDAIYQYEGQPFHGGAAEWLRTARRPKPEPDFKSLVERALAQMNAILNDPTRFLQADVRETLESNRRELKRLQELEGQADG